MFSDYQVVLGAEAAIWTEQASSSNMFTRLFPRTWALAERLWSNPPVVSNYSSWEYGVYMLGVIHKNVGKRREGVKKKRTHGGREESSKNVRPHLVQKLSISF